MRRALSTLLLLGWGLWFGGLWFLFFAVTALFGRSRELGAAAAPVVFARFEKYHLILAAVCLILCVILVQISRKRTWNWIFVLLVIGCITSLITAGFLTPQINSLQAQGLIHTPEFNRLHGLASIVYLCEVIAILLVGLLLPGAMIRSRIREN